MQNMIMMTAAEAAKIAETGPNINGTVMSLIIVACTVLVAVVFAIFIHSKTR